MADRLQRDETESERDNAPTAAPSQPAGYGTIVTPPPRLFPTTPESCFPGTKIPRTEDPTGAGKAALEFLTNFHLVEGRGAGLQITPETMPPWMTSIVSTVMGHCDPATGSRYIRELFISIPRKSAKSTCIAMIALLLLASTRASPNEIVVAAGSAKQASRLWEILSDIARTYPPFAEQLRIVGFPRYELQHKITGTRLRCMPSDPDKLMGLSVGVLIVDEVAFLPTEKGKRMYNSLVTSMGSRLCPLVMLISTVSDEPMAEDSLFAEKLSYARKVESGAVDDRSFLPMIYICDEDADVSDPDVWAACNPSLGYSVTHEEIAKAYEVAAASGSDSEINAFRTLRLNQLPKQARGAGVISAPALAKCLGPVSLDMFADCDSVVLGVDLSQADDISAISAMGRMGDRYILASWGWITRESFNRCRSKVGWFDKVAGKTLTIVDQEIIEASLVCEEALSIAESVGARDIAVDPAMAGLFVKGLEDSGSGIVVHYARQGMSSVAPAISFLASLLIRQQITVANDGLLQMAFENATVVSSSIGARIAKIGGEAQNYGHNPRKIDPLSAALNCCQLFVAGLDTGVVRDDDVREAVSAWTEPARAANIKFRQQDGDGDLSVVDEYGRVVGHPIGTQDALGAYILSPCEEKQWGSWT